MPDHETSYRPSINDRLEARSFLEAIGYHTDKLRVIGGGERAPIKAPCPVHGDPRLATLMVDPARNSCKCVVARCAAHEGVDLVQLLGLVRGLPASLAALAAAELGGLELAPGERDAIAEDLAEDAAAALDASDAGAAQAALEALARLAPSHPAQARLAARAAEATGDVPQAVEAYRRLADEALVSGDAPGAVRLLREDALRLAPQDEPALEALVAAADAAADAPTALDAILRLARLRAAAGTPPPLGLLDRLGDAVLGDAPLVLLRARGRAAAGREPEARADALVALGACEGDARAEALEVLLSVAGEDPAAHLAAGRARLEAGDAAGALASAEQALALQPGAPEPLALALDALEAGPGTEDPAARALEFLLAARAAGDAGLAGRARSLAEAAAPGDRDVLVALAQDAHDHESPAAGAERLAAVAREAAPEEAIDLLRRVLEWDPSRREDRRALVGHLREAGRLPEAFDEAALLLQGNEPVPAGDPTLVEELAGDDPELLLRAARQLVEAGLPERSLLVLRDLIDSPDAALARRAAQVARLATPEDPHLLGFLVESHRQAGEVDEAVDAGMALFRVLDKRRDALHAMGLLEQLTEIDPAAPEPRRALAQRHEAAGERPEAAFHWFELAQVLGEAGDAEGGREAARRAIALQEHLHEPVLWLAGSLRGSGEEAEARELLLGAARKALDEARLAAAEALVAGLLEADGEDLDALELSARARADKRDAKGALAALRALAAAARARKDKAREEQALRDILGMDPADLPSREALADLLAREGDERAADFAEQVAHLVEDHAAAHRWSEALAAQRRLLALHPEDLSARAKHARLLEASGDTTRAASEFVKLGAAHRHLGALEAASEAVEQAFRLRPGLPEALRLRMEIARDRDQNTSFAESGSLLVEALGSEDRTAEASEIARQLVEAQPANHHARELLAQCLLKAGDARGAALARLEAAEMLVADGRASRARSAAELAESQGIQDAELQGRLGRLWLRLEEPERAQRPLLAAARALGQAGDHAGALGALDALAALAASEEGRAQVAIARAESLQRLGRHGEAVEALRAAASGARAGLRADLLLRAHELGTDDADLQLEAGMALADAGRAPQGAQLLLQASEALEKAGNLDGALEAAETAARLVPDGSLARRRLSSVQRARGDASAAVEQLRKLIASQVADGAGPEALVALHDEALQLAPRDEALRAGRGKALAALGRGPQAAQDLGIAASIALEQGRTADAETLLADALDANPGDRAARTVRARLLEEEGRLEEALAEHFQLVSAAVAEGNIEEARALVDRVTGRLPGALDWRLQVAELCAREGIPELAAMEYTSTAQALLAAGRAEEAREACRKALAARPRDLDAHEMLVAACKQLRDTQGAASALESLANLLEESGLTDRVAQALSSLVAFRPDDASLRARLADAHSRLGRTTEAIEVLRSLARIQHESGEDQQAVLTLRRLLALAPEDTRARASLLEAASEVEDPRALLDDHLKLAGLHLRRGELADARRVLAAAEAIDPELPQVRELLLAVALESGDREAAVAQGLELARLLSEIGEARRAGDVLDQVREAGAGDPAYFRARARVHAALNARGKAMEALREALRLHREAGDRPARVEVLRELVEVDPHNVETRRELVELLRKLDRMEEAGEAQVALGQLLLHRDMPDLAEAEFRAVTILTPFNDAAWQGLIEAHRRYGQDVDLVSDYLRFGELLEQQGRRAEALEHFSSVIRLEPTNISARESYIRLYAEHGAEADLVEDYLALADLLIGTGRIDEGIRLFGKVMSIDPDNHEARERISETQARLKQGAPPPPPRTPVVPRRHQARQEPDESNPHEPRMTREQEAMAETMAAPRGGAQRFLLEEVDNMEDDEEREALEQVAASYRDILAINPNNATVRLKLADLLEQTGRQQDALMELAQASELFFRKNEHQACIAACERILKVDPGNQKIRLRLQQSLNRRDAFKALESAIIFSDNQLDEGGSPRRPGD